MRDRGRKRQQAQADPEEERGTKKLILSFRGAKRRGNPYCWIEKAFFLKGTGLPRRSADWLAMTDFRRIAFRQEKKEPCGSIFN